MSDSKYCYLYRDYVRTISTQFDSEFTSILAHHNYEYGPEFEIALCNVLGRILPDKYGICRGYIVDAIGECAGDDIIIFDKLRFPTLVRSNADRVLRKEYVPAEAVYAYIEAKHCLELRKDNRQGITKALRQIADVRKLCRERSIPAKPSIKRNRDQLFCMITSRGIQNNGNVIESAEDLYTAFPSKDTLHYPAPDCIVCGNNCIAIPVNENKGVKSISDVFIRHESCYLLPRSVNGVAFGAAVISLLQALNSIDLGDYPTWQILQNAISPDDVFSVMHTQYIKPIDARIHRDKGETAQQYKNRRNDELRKLLPDASKELKELVEKELERKISFPDGDRA